MALSMEQMLEAYRRMRTIREFEENIHRENTTGEIPGFLHLYCGQEANAVAVCSNWKTLTASPATTVGTATASPRVRM